MPRALSDLDFNSTSRIINLPDPTAAQHAATRAYVDANIEGLAWKDSVRVSTQANLNLSSPGATIDGVTMATSDRVLVRSQTAAAENGIYIFNGSAVAMTRSLDASTFDELEAAVTTVEEGTSAGSSFRQTAVNGTLGTTSVTWTTFGTSAPSATTSTAGIVRLATQGEVNTGTDATIAVTPATLASYSGLIKKFSQTFGDGSATQYDITHNFNTTDVVVSVRNASTNAEVICDISRNSVNVVRLNFATAPASNSHRVTVIG